MLIWMFFEMLMIISSIIATVFFLLIRSFDRGSYDLSIDTSDLNKDFISAFTTQVKLVLMMMCSSPAISNSLFLLFYSQKKEDIIEEQRPILMIQLYMQLVQLVCFLIFNSLRPTNTCRYYISFLLLLTMMVIVPLVSIGHYSWTTYNRLTWLSGYN